MIARRLICVVLLGCGAAGLPAGCVERRIVRDSFADLRELADAQRSQQPAPDQASASDKNAQAVGFAILVAEFEGRAAQGKADHLMRQLGAEAHVSDLWVIARNDKMRVMRGLYPDANDDRALNDLQATRDIIINGSKPYESARLIRIDGDPLATDNPYDLHNYSGRYSLQIGFYDDEFGPKFRAAAEQAVNALRADGEEAYFYHGPNMSLVTVGLFTDADNIQRVIATPDGRQVFGNEYSPRVRELQRKYPYNLGNGITLLESHDQGPSREMKSFLVQVP